MLAPVATVSAVATAEVMVTEIVIIIIIIVINRPPNGLPNYLLSSTDVICKERFDWLSPVAFIVHRLYLKCKEGMQAGRQAGRQTMCRVQITTLRIVDFPLCLTPGRCSLNSQVHSCRYRPCTALNHRRGEVNYQHFETRTVYLCPNSRPTDETGSDITEKRDS